MSTAGRQNKPFYRQNLSKRILQRHSGVCEETFDAKYVKFHCRKVVWVIA